ncbi:putative F-box protein At3g16210 [Lathyrus oleraceus]|uniref:putative F-box protein At3g16210 n=1 Tax=Pisum sativum TaxID=3888 RepID=UPI0021D1B35A|nr:putative F-box protein At3g16210 [Pisum sativum]
MVVKIADQTLKPLSMKKSVGVKSKKVSTDIPNDLLFSILSKLSLKSLKRFECVCKPWTLLLKNPVFTRLLCDNFLHNFDSYYHDRSLFLSHLKTINFDTKFVLYSYSGERYENMTNLNWPNPFQEEDPNFDILGSGIINGVLCLISCSHQSIKFVLWNPTTEEFKVIPNSPFDFFGDRFEINERGFGYDCVGDDYKVIREITLDLESDYVTKIASLGKISHNPFWEIYSLRSNSWKKLKFDIHHEKINKGVCLDGVCHWLCERNYKDDKGNEIYLLSFYLNDEVFLITPIEDPTFQLGTTAKELCVLNGFIALISTNEDMVSLQISILGELGVKESWIKLFIIYPLPYIVYPIGVGNKGDILLLKEDRKLISFNLSTEQIEELNFAGNHFCGTTILYKESLRLILG